MTSSWKKLVTFALASLALTSTFVAGGPDRLGAQATTGTVLRIATIAPRGSPWHRVFGAWSNSLRDATQGRVSLQVVGAGAQGDERTFGRRMRANEIDGATLTALGLADVAPGALVLQAPGLFDDYARLDRARTALDGDLRAAFHQGGVELMGWTDVGRGRVFSTRPIQTPADLRAAHPWLPNDEATLGELLHVVGATGVTAAIPEVLPALTAGRIDVVMASATAVSALQWHTRLTHVTAQPTSVLVSATVISADDVNALSAADQQALRDTATRAHEALTRQMRRDDDRYYTELTTHGMTAVDISAHRAEWDRVARDAREHLVGRLYSRELLQRASR